MIRKILKVFGLALYSDLQREVKRKNHFKELEQSKFNRMYAAKEYVEHQRSDENGVAYLGEDEWRAFVYILFNGADDTENIEQLIENAEEFVANYSE